jgi:hypothetical protein
LLKWSCLVINTFNITSGYFLGFEHGVRLPDASLEPGDEVFSYPSLTVDIDPAKTEATKSLPSGKHTKNYGKIHHVSWVNQLFLWPFSIANCSINRG